MRHYLRFRANGHEQQIEISRVQSISFLDDPDRANTWVRNAGWKYESIVGIFVETMEERDRRYGTERRFVGPGSIS